MSLLQKAYDDILKLRGADVTVFGQSTTLDAEVDEFTIDILEVMDALKQYEVREFEGYDNVNEYLENLIESGVIESEDLQSDNSYNWNSNVSNHFNFYAYKTFYDNILVEFKVHRYGDVRGNYTVSFLLEFESFDEFLEVLSEVSMYATIEVNNINYDLYCSVFDEGIEVSDIDGYHITTTYENEREYIIQDILSELE